MKAKILICAVFGMLTGMLSAQNALDFDGNDDRVECGKDSSVALVGTTLTLEAWIYANYWQTETYDGTILAKYDEPSNRGYVLAAGNNGRLHFSINDDSTAELNTLKPVLTLNKWHHVAVTYNGKVVRMFVDGVAVDTLSEDMAIGDSKLIPLTIGNHYSYYRPWSGLIDEVRIWKRVKTPAEISAYKNSKYCTYDKTLRAYYNFNQGKASASNTTVKTLLDWSAYGNNGTLKNFNLTGSYSNWVKGVVLSQDVISKIDTVVRCDRYPSPSKKYIYTASGTYYDTLLTKQGCDSAMKIILTIRKSTASKMVVRTCSNFLSPSKKNTYTQSGVYQDFLLNAAGCDSLITIVLRVGPDSTFSKETRCDVFKMPISKREVRKSGVYIDTLKNYIGCDSLLFIDVNILNSTQSVTKVNFCRTYTIPTNNKTVYTEGTYYDTLTNYLGCDSVISFVLKSKATNSFYNDFACGSFESPSKKYIWNKSGIYKDTLVNVAGCDSIVTTDLVITNNSYNKINIKQCRKYRVPSRKYFIIKSGTYFDTLINFAGCDSILEISADIININKSILINGEFLNATDLADNYQWLFCDSGYKWVAGETQSIFKPISPGRFAVAMELDGCKDTSECKVFKTNSVAKIAKAERLFYPNPSNSLIYFAKDFNHEDLKVVVWNVQGALLAEHYKVGANGIRLPDLAGVYLIQIFDKDELIGSERILKLPE